MIFSLKQHDLIGVVSLSDGAQLLGVFLAQRIGHRHLTQNIADCFVKFRPLAVVGLRAYFKPVDVLWQGEDYCLVRPVTIDSTSESAIELYTLRVNDEVIISANDLYDGKVIE